MMGDTFPAESNCRTVNNVLRHEYRELSDLEKELMRRVKDKGVELLALLHEIGNTNPQGEHHASRQLALAATKIEEAVMWAVKHITR
jgi:hypothetical protein